MAPVLTKDDFIYGLTPVLAEPMLAVILAFARLDTALSAWLLQSYGIELSRGAMLIENMDTGNKIARLKKIHDHDGDERAVSALGKVKKEFDKYRAARNTIAHATFIGSLKSDQERAVFAPVRTGDSAGLLQVVILSTEHMR